MPLPIGLNCFEQGPELQAAVHALRGLLRGLVEDALDVAGSEEAQGWLRPGYTHLGAQEGSWALGSKKTKSSLSSP